MVNQTAPEQFNRLKPQQHACIPAVHPFDCIAPLQQLYFTVVLDWGTGGLVNGELVSMNTVHVKQRMCSDVQLRYPAHQENVPVAFSI